MTERLGGKAAIVTGGTSGIGLSIVETFRRHGATVIFTGRDVDRGRSVAEATGGVFVAADAADRDQAAKVVGRALELVGRVDVLVNNAGGPGHRGGVEKTPPEAIDESIGIHLTAPWLLMAEVAPVMRSQGGGSIVNLTSVAGQRVGVSFIAYSVAKAALLHLTRCAAAEFGHTGIRVNSISPGFIATQIHGSCFDTEEARAAEIMAMIQRKFVARQALSVAGEPKDVAEAALYLASDESRFVTGADLVVDAGAMWGQSGLV